MSGFQKKLLFLLILALSVYGCASPRTGPLILHPAEKDSDGYMVKGDAWVFENKSIRITATHVNTPIGSSVLDRLLEEEYVFLRLDIENRSTVEKILFNPTLAALKYSSMGYEKPLDYTDFYSIAEAGDAEKLLVIKGRFYDTTEKILPGGKISKFLIFRPFSEDPRKAELVLKNIDLGKEFLDLRFPFVLKPEDPF